MKRKLLWIISGLICFILLFLIFGSFMYNPEYNSGFFNPSTIFIIVSLILGFLLGGAIALLFGEKKEIKSKKVRGKSK